MHILNYIVKLESIFGKSIRAINSGNMDSRFNAMKGLKCEVLGIVVIFLVIIFDISLFGEGNDFF